MYYIYIYLYIYEKLVVFICISKEVTTDVLLINRDIAIHINSFSI